MSTAIIDAFFKITSFAFVPRWTSAGARHTFAIPNPRTFSVPVTTRGRLSDIKPSSSIRASTCTSMSLVMVAQKCFKKKKIVCGKECKCKCLCLYFLKKIILTKTRSTLLTYVENSRGLCIPQCRPPHPILRNRYTCTWEYRRKHHRCHDHCTSCCNRKPFGLWLGNGGGREV